MTPKLAIGRFWPKSYDPAKTEPWYTSLANKLSPSGPPDLQAPSREKDADMRRVAPHAGRDPIKGWDPFNRALDQHESLHPDAPPFPGAFPIKASVPRPIDTSDPAYDKSWCVVSNDIPANSEMAPPASSSRPPQSNPCQTSGPLSSSDSSSDRSTVFRGKDALPSDIRVFPPVQYDTQPGSNNLGSPSVPNTALLQPFQTTAVSPFQQRLSSSPSRLPEKFTEFRGHLQYTRKCRLRLRELRRQIRVIEDKKVDAENALQSAVRRLAVQPSAGQMLVKLFQNLETIRNEANELQMEHDTLERKLEQREFRLETSGMGLLQELEISQVPRSHHPTSGSPRSNILYMPDHQEEAYRNRATSATQGSTRAGLPVYEYKITTFPATTDDAFRGMVGNESIDIPPLFRKLVNTVAELKMAEEEHEEILEQRQEIVSTLYSRFLIAASGDKTNLLDEAQMDKARAACDSIFSVGITAEFLELFGSFLVSSDLQFLEDFGYSEEELLAAARGYTEQINRLRSECLRTGAIPNHLTAKERIVLLGEEDDGTHDISMDPTPEFNIPVGQSRLPNPLTRACFPILRHNCWHLLTTSPMTPKSALTNMLQLPTEFPYRAARIEDLVKEYGIETMLTRFEDGNKADFVNRWLLQQLRMSSVNELVLFAVSSQCLGIVDLAVWQRNVIYFWARDGTNRLENPEHGSEVANEDTSPPRG